MKKKSEEDPEKKIAKLLRKSKVPEGRRIRLILSLPKPLLMYLVRKVLWETGKVSTADQIAHEIMQREYGEAYYDIIDGMRTRMRLGSRVAQFLNTKSHGKKTRRNYGIALKLQEGEEWKYTKPLQFYIPKIEDETGIKRNSEGKSGQQHLSLYT